jgi:hypothetical protein
MYNAYTFITSPGTSDNSSSGWASTNTITNPGPLVIGTTFYNWVQFSAAGEYTGGNAIAVTGTLIDALYDGQTISVNGSNQLHIPANAPLTTPNIGDATGNSLSVTGSITGNVLVVNTASAVGNALVGNITTGNISITGNVLTDLNVTTNIAAGNIVSHGLLSAVGNVYGGNISSANIYDTSIGAGHIVFGNADSTGRLSSTSTLTTDGNNISAGGNVSVGGAVSATGNVTAANFSTSGSGGNITGANVISGITLTASGNVYGQNLVTPNTTIGGNITTTGLISATGNIQTANFFIGDGAYISNINAANVSSIKISNGGSYANIASPNGNLVIAVGTGSNVAATFYDNGVNFGGDISTVGNVSASLITGTLTTNAQPNVTSVGTLTSLDSGTISSSGNVTGANILTGGDVSATGNIFAGTDISAVGNLTVAGNSTLGGYGQVVTLQGSTNLQLGSGSFSYGSSYSISGITGDITANNVSAAGNVQSGTTFFVDTTTSSVSLGANVVETTGATLAINATDSMLLPVGNTLQRPATPATGMLRYNSTVSQCEIWNGAAWVAVGGSSYTVITNEQFNGDGTTVQFTLGSSQTTDSCIVTINGVVQIPTTAYSVSGVYPTCYLTFTEAPEIGDTIDVREITTTTSVTAISNSPGNAVVSVSQTSGEVDITGNLVAQLNASAPSLVANSSMSFQLVNNTTLKILVRGTDGTTRSANITLS